MAKKSAVVTDALAFYDLTATAWDPQRQRERDDLDFQIPDVEHQWDPVARAARSAQIVDGIAIPERPMLCVSTTDEPIQLVTNQIRAAHLGVQIHPISEEASDDTAQVLQGLYRNIEVTSRAATARNWAADRSTKCGSGVWRVGTEYDPDSDYPGDQRIVIKRVLYQDAVRLDPFAQEPDWSDGRKALVLEQMPIARYKARWKDSKVADFGDKDFAKMTETFPGWFDSVEGARTVQVAEFYWLEEDTNEIEVTDWKGNRITVPDPANQRRLHWSIVNAVEELEPDQVIPGKYIPLIPLIGRELQPVRGERHFIGMIRPAKDGARLTNYAASNAVKMAALEPEAPWIMEEGQDEGHPEWTKSNTVPYPALKFRRIGLSGIPGAEPHRVQVDVSRLGPSMALLSMGRDFVQSATATYDPALGKQTSAHRSGRALMALQDQTTEGTSHYLDNLAQVAMPYEAKVVLDLIPHYYDRPGRIATILDENDKPSQVMLNAPFQPNAAKRPTALPFASPADQAQTSAMVENPDHPAKHYDLSKGRYGVSVTVGKSSASRLQEGDDFLSRIIEAAPQLMMVLGPEWMKYKDHPGARQVANILEKVREHDMPWLSDSPDAQMPQKLEQAQQQIQMLTEQLQKASELADRNRTQLEITHVKEQNENARAALDREVKLAVAELGAKVDRMALFIEERARVGSQEHDAAQADLARAHEAALGQQEHAQNLEAGAMEHAHELEAGDVQHAQTLEQGAQAAALAPQPEEAGA